MAIMVDNGPNTVNIESRVMEIRRNNMSSRLKREGLIPTHFFQEQPIYDEFVDQTPSMCVGSFDD